MVIVIAAWTKTVLYQIILDKSGNNIDKDTCSCGDYIL